MQKNILIIAVFHGDEPQGEFFINEFLKIPRARGKNKLVFVSRLNTAATRKNPNGVDLNRNFPTINWVETDPADDYYGGKVPASEIETRGLIDIIKKTKFDAIISIHAPYGIINFDPYNKPTYSLATTVGEILGYPLQAEIGYPTPGSFGTYCGAERNIPTITIEVDDKTNPKELLPKFFELFDYLEHEY